jgi:hypothetical protein
LAPLSSALRILYEKKVKKLIFKEIMRFLVVNKRMFDMNKLRSSKKMSFLS